MLKYLQYEEVDVDITENLYNVNCTPKSFFVEKDFEIRDPKIHSPHHYLQSFLCGRSHLLMRDQ